MSTYTRKLLTLMFIREGEKILLGYKKRGFGQGRWNGFGGKVEAGETPEQAAIRETKEEAGAASEMRPAWFPVSSLPFAQMWPDDRFWFPLLLRGAKFRGAFHFRGHDEILSQKLEEVKEF
ncbi:7,8-dihydro-8-oxoguanine triphosphatase-like [Penaeus monodon]|uniref:7,8-dihydro-8-oxoguanine triphosphatase-like n=1 Tax=Penaeus monodon TaxID=6687 RepID=UPI0018A7D083|nr:7,8-dihydro-8-oxoguanine triphosphatase-like [Penaeus monodon]